MAGRIAVIGAGVIGLFTALELARRGWRVTVVERNEERRDGCSYGNAGLIVPSHFVPLAAPGMTALALKWMLKPRAPFRVRPRASWTLVEWTYRFWRAADAARVRRAAPLLRDMALESRRRYEALAAAGNDFGFEKGGTLMLCASRRGLDEERRTADLARTLGLSAEVLDPEATAGREPGIRMNVVGSVHYTDDCRIAPDLLMAGLQHRATEAGATFVWNTGIVGWKTARGGAIRAAVTRDGGAIEADEYVLCAGSWSARLARGLEVTLPLEAGAGYSLTLARPRVLPRHSAILTESRVAVTPLGGLLRFGGTMELAGLDAAAEPARARAIADAATRYYPDLRPSDFDGVDPWHGLRPCSPDGLPYLGRSARCPNLLIATGHAMLGMTLAPVTGTLMAALASGEKPALDMTLLSPDRYGCR